MSGDSALNEKPATARVSRLTCHALRLHPGQNLTEELVKYVKANDLRAAFVMTCVGSVKRAVLRLATATSTDEGNHIKEINSSHEVTSLVGTICSSGKFHLHTTLGDDKGQTLSGHVMGGMEIFTTVEIVLGECDDLAFTREMDEETGFDELVVSRR